MPCVRAVLSSLLLLTACDGRALAPESPEPPAGPPGPGSPLVMEAMIDGFRYTVTDGVGFAVSSIEINKGGIVVGATLPSPGGHLTASLSEYRLVVAGADGDPLPSRVEYTPTGAFGGTLYWIAPGQAVTLSFGIHHVPAGRYVLGPYPVVIVRRGDPGSGPAPEPDPR
jgi:hypothetical protein